LSSRKINKIELEGASISSGWLCPLQFCSMKVLTALRTTRVLFRKDLKIKFETGGSNISIPCDW
jgi:hypothetical protein